MTTAHPDCGCRPPGFFCCDQHRRYHAKQAAESVAHRADHTYLSRAERRARGHRGGLIPREVAAEVASRRGMTPQEVTQAYIDQARQR